MTLHSLEPFCSIAENRNGTIVPSVFRFYVTYDDTDNLVQQVRIENDGSRPALVTLKDPVTNATVYSYTSPPGQHQTWNIPTGQRPALDQYAISCQQVFS